MRRMHHYRAVLMEVIDFEKQALKEDLDVSNTHVNKWFSKAQARKVGLRPLSILATEMPYK